MDTVLRRIRETALQTAESIVLKYKDMPAECNSVQLRFEREVSNEHVLDEVRKVIEFELIALRYLLISNGYVPSYTVKKLSNKLAFKVTIDVTSVQDYKTAFTDDA